MGEEEHPDDRDVEEHVLAAEVSEEVALRINSSVRLEERLRLRRERTGSCSPFKQADVEKAIEALVSHIEGGEQVKDAGMVEVGAEAFEVSDGEEGEEEEVEVGEEEEEEARVHDPGPEVAVAIADIVDQVAEMQLQLSQSRRRRVNRRIHSSDVVAGATPITLNPHVPEDGNRSDSNPSSRPSSASHRRKVRNRSRDNLLREGT